MLQGEEIGEDIAAQLRAIVPHGGPRPRHHLIEREQVGRIVGEGVWAVIFLGRVGGISIPGMVVRVVEPGVPHRLPEPATHPVPQRHGPIAVAVVEIVE